MSQAFIPRLQTKYVWSITTLGKCALLPGHLFRFLLLASGLNFDIISTLKSHGNTENSAGPYNSYTGMEASREKLRGSELFVVHCYIPHRIAANTIAGKIQLCGVIATKDERPFGESGAVLAHPLYKLLHV